MEPIKRPPIERDMEPAQRDAIDAEEMREIDRHELEQKEHEENSDPLDDSD